VPVNDDAKAEALQPAPDGVGPLVQRDYWALIDRSHCRPSGVMKLVTSNFPELPASDVVVFQRDGGGDPHALEVGDELDIRIRLAGPARVRVVHRCKCSVTLATLKGHPEAGRITFGSYRATDGNVVFHIRSRARSSSLLNYLGFLIGGDPMQTTTWTDFVNDVAHTCGSGVLGSVQVETRTLEPSELEPGDETLDAPTFVADGD